jgi:Xaa-Pro aminopeptidase
VDTKKAIQNWQNLMKEKNTDLFYLPSFDHFLSEYVPSEDSLRLHLTSFTGSVAEVLIPAQGKIKLYVDGRYHEQADEECELELIEVVKVPYGESLFESLLRDVGKDKSLGYFPERTPFQSLQKFLAQTKVIEFNEEDFHHKCSFKVPVFKGELFEPEYEQTGLVKKWQRVLGEGEAAFINALDTLSWVSGLRANHLPYQGTFRGLGYLTQEKLLIFVDDELFPNAKKWANPIRHIYSVQEMTEVLKGVEKPVKLWWDPSYTNAANYKMITKVFDGIMCESQPGFHAKWQAPKTPSEIQAFRESFEKSDQAIYQGLCWLIESVRAGQKVSELAFRDKVNEYYSKMGAKCQSFRTIAGFGSHGSIIHFGKPSAEKHYQTGELVLLDSGAIYEQGLATDCTRTIIPMGRASKKQRLEYTLVLKGLLSILMASVPKGTPGKVLDEMARAPLKEHGLNYAHGTGHGVGINVHEAGYSLTPVSEVPLVPGVVGSMEPGYYEPGVGGIRLENIVIVKEDPKNSQNVCFENLVTLGFWQDLIERDLLGQEEKDYLDNYERQCSKVGRSFAKFCQ